MSVGRIRAFLRVHLLVVSAALALLVPGCKTEAQKPPPGPLQAGVAKGRIPCPLGIPTVGYGPGGSGPSTPFNFIYPGTKRIHAHPELRVLVLSRGDDYELIFIRADTVGIFQHIRNAVVNELELRFERPMNDKLVFGGTHTHAGPGRVIDAGAAFDIIADRFFPDFYVALVHRTVELVEAAYADLAPARVGHVLTSAPQGHNDRRCEDGNPDYTNDELPVVAVERAGQIDAVMFAYSMHGTILGSDDANLSREGAGAIEAWVEAGFDHPVQAMFFNSWGADMSPGHPNDVPMDLGAAMPDGYERMATIGYSVAQTIHTALTDISFSDEVEISGELHRVPLSNEAIGYEWEEFPYEAGAVYCGVNDSNPNVDCDISTTIDILHTTCVDFALGGEPPPMQTEISAGRIGTLNFVTFPGEPGTRLAEEIMSRLRDEHGVGDIMFFGYTQDYSGYAIREDDWWQGGYEASGHMWGPKQGEYLIDQAVLAYGRTFNGTARPPASEIPDPIVPFDVSSFDPYVPTPGEDVGTFARDASPVYDIEDVVEVIVLGNDPFLGAPLAILVDDSGEPVLGPNNAPIDSDGYAFWVTLDYDPLYADDKNAATRRFLWTISMPAQQTVPGLLPDLTAGGPYQLKIVVPTDGDSQEVFTASFTVE